MNWTTMRPGSNWSDPAYLFDYFCARFGGQDWLQYHAFREALKIAKRIVALGAFDDVEEVFDAAGERAWLIDERNAALERMLP